jgi:signal transduction histidine kinase
MHDPSQSTRAELRVGEVAQRAADPALGDTRGYADLADHSRRRRPGLMGEERDIEAGGSVLVTVVSHELRNSLGAIGSAIRILGLEAPAPAAAQARTVIERQVAKMTALVEDLLDISRSQHGPMRLQCGRGDLRAIAAHATQSVEFTMQQHNHRMVTSFPDAPVWVQADAARLEQAFVNLLLNAAKYTAPGGHITLSVGREDGEAVVRVRDDGIGIDPDVLPHVFDLFVQATPSSQRTDAGLGIGLALVRSVVDRHGGRVTAASAGPGCGSEFAVHLPTPAK